MSHYQANDYNKNSPKNSGSKYTNFMAKNRDEWIEDRYLEILEKALRADSWYLKAVNCLYYGILLGIRPWGTIIAFFIWLEFLKWIFRGGSMMVSSILFVFLVITNWNTLMSVLFYSPSSSRISAIFLKLEKLLNTSADEVYDRTGYRPLTTDEICQAYAAVEYRYYLTRLNLHRLRRKNPRVYLWSLSAVFGVIWLINAILGDLFIVYFLLVGPILIPALVHYRVAPRFLAFFDPRYSKASSYGDDRRERSPSGQTLDFSSWNPSEIFSRFGSRDRGAPSSFKRGISDTLSFIGNAAKWSNEAFFSDEVKPYNISGSHPKFEKPEEGQNFSDLSQDGDSKSSARKQNETVPEKRRVQKLDKELNDPSHKPSRKLLSWIFGASQAKNTIQTSSKDSENLKRPDDNEYDFVSESEDKKNI